MALDGAKRKGFTLIELLVVIGLLGALATIVMPQLSADREAVLDDGVVPAEMMNIRNAFSRFVADCAPGKSDYERIGNDKMGGLAILWERPADSSASFPASWDKDRERGWRGPYLTGMGGIDRANRRLRDPLFNNDLDGPDRRCYLVVGDGGSLYLLYTGRNGEDESSGDYAGDPKGDDKILLLAPDVLE
ncbi:MAG: type II secretion system GspH family protein [Planctomycetota bacterium]|jgi:prepilin-type N-terminal cleavage/methylation domain-containing protein|nr:type II secretion system GspH family protein [Planctomycetota bacterium]